MQEQDLFNAIQNDDLEAVKAWVSAHGLETELRYNIPEAQFDDWMSGTPFTIAVMEGQSRIALWLLENGAQHHTISYHTVAGYSSDATYHPLGTAIVAELEDVVAYMLNQDINWQLEQYTWNENLADSGSWKTFGSIFLKHKTTRPLLERIGRLDVLDTVAKLDLRTREQKAYDADMAAQAAEEAV